MGARLAMAALDTARRQGFDGAATRALVRMSLSALDDDPKPVYYGGWENIANAIGRTVDPNDPRSIRAAKEAVRVAMRPLAEAEVVEVGQRAAPGRNTRYNLHLTVQAQPVPMTSETVQAHLVNGPGSDRQTVQAHPGPEEKKEEIGGGRASAPTTCPKHPQGNSSEPCRSCMDARKARDAMPTTSAIHSVRPGPDGWCSSDGHRRQPDGTCLLCDHRDEPLVDWPMVPVPVIEETTS